MELIAEDILRRKEYRDKFKSTKHVHEGQLSDPRINFFTQC